MKDQLLGPKAQDETAAGPMDGMSKREASHPPVQRENTLAGRRERPASARPGDGRDPSRPPPKASSGLAASLLGFTVVASVAGAVAWSTSCRSEAPPGPSADLPARGKSLPAPSARASAPPAAPLPSASAAPATSATAETPSDAPYTGPLLGALAVQTAVYGKPEFSKKELGYIRLGGKVPVEAGMVKDASGKCSTGWYHLVDGGYVCGRHATLDIKSAQVRLGITAPNLEDLLPYRYAYNTAHGTPLYRSVPSKEEMLKYEPYLEAAKRAKHKDGDAAEASSADPPSSADKAAAEALGLMADDAGASPPEDEKPWWQQGGEKGKPVQVKLDDLTQDSDSTLAKRMVKGFFVAIDKTFAWNSRSWYKTTTGLVAPADRMYIVKAPATKGMDFPEGVKQIGFITASHASKYTFDADQKKVAAAGSVPRFTTMGLTGSTVTSGGAVYRQTTEGWWMKAVDGTYTDPGPKPADLAPNEKWIDVNLTRKTLVALEGDKPVFGALISPGKRSKDKAHDHPTVQGMFRIREKHIAVTMDGDGKLASDLPYSIEDVPYVQYFEGSYALHGAFWHNNFGHDMSHGCVNLAPLDAKRVFYWSEPHLPRGWHAAWSTPENRGTVVVVHEDGEAR